MKTRYKISMGLTALHLTGVYFIISAILSGAEPDWPIYWYLMIPFNLLALAVSYIPLPFLDTLFEHLASQHPSSSPLSDVTNFWYPAYIVAFLGTIQWFVIPLIFGKTIDILKKKANKKMESTR